VPALPAVSPDAATVAAPPLIELAGLHVAFGARIALSDVSLALGPGEIVTIIGPNGAGKTTLLRVALGLQRADAGTVRRRPGLRVGYVPQRLAIDETLPLTVRRFLALVPGAKPPAMTAALTETGAQHTLDLPLQTLSGGELQRVLLARALLREPELLVLDEPVQGVDITGQAELFALIRRLRDTRRCGVLLVSHDLHLVMAATDRVICLNHHVCCSGHPDTVSRDPAYRALFGAAIDGFAVYAHHHDHRHDHSHDHHHHHDGHRPDHAHDAADRPPPHG
jgi:zinc transport system ATP-binding protein